jgi:hypothetical protein
MDFAGWQEIDFWSLTKIIYSQQAVKIRFMPCGKIATFKITIVAANTDKDITWRDIVNGPISSTAKVARMPNGAKFLPN